MASKNNFNKVNFELKDAIQDMSEIKASTGKMNEELGIVRDRLTKLETNQGWFKEKLKCIEDRIWYIVTAVIIMGILSISASAIFSL